LRKILLIGGHGYLGSNIQKSLSKKFYIISPKNKKKLNILKTYQLQKFINKDLFCIINLTGQIGKYANKINTMGNKNVIKVIKKKKINPLLIFFSTTLVKNYKKHINKQKTQDNKIENYTKSKLNGENILRKNYENYIILRVSHVYDGKFKKRGIFNNIINSIKEKKLLKISNIHTFRNYIHIKDVICHLKNLLNFQKKNISNRIITLANENYSIKNIVKMFERKYNRKLETINLKLDLNKDYSQKIFTSSFKYTNHVNKYQLKKVIKKYNEKN